MKKISLLFILLFSSIIYSQTSGITYQALILNPEGEHIPGHNNDRAPLVKKQICLRFKIFTGDSKLDYQETIVTTTDEFGMVNVVIGTGTPTGGTAQSFDEILWNIFPKSLVVEVDLKGLCSTFTEISNQPFTSVPYALHAANAKSTVVKTSIEPESENCEDGGVKLEFGFDANNNGLLDTLEIDDTLTKYVCNGANGVDGAAGSQGPQGPAGPQGPQGPQGPSGTMQNGVNLGDMLYWDGTAWVILPIGKHGENLSVCNGVPTWGSCISTTNGTAIISSFNSCATASTGTLTAGVVVTGVTQTINVTVSKIGNYNISATANGITFSATGSFTTVGTQNVVLTASGTPIVAGTNTFTLNTTPNCSFTLTTVPYTVTDIGGNTYPTVKICDQVWMQSNLNSDRYRNGDIIPQATNSTQWNNATTGMWCYYQFNSVNGPIYGKMYNWFAITDTRGLAPQGWHIPSKTEWEQLINCNQGKNVAGGALKSIDGWGLYNTGGTNSSGFSALPGGFYNYYTGSQELGQSGYWWSNTQYNATNAWGLWLQASTTTAVLDYSFVFAVGTLQYNSGLFVRCVKD